MYSTAHRNKFAQGGYSEGEPLLALCPGPRILTSVVRLSLPKHLMLEIPSMVCSLTHGLINGQLRMIDSSYEVTRMYSLLHSLKVINNSLVMESISTFFFTKNLSVYLYLILFRSFFFSLSEFFPMWCPLLCP